MALSLRQTLDQQERKALWLAGVPSITLIVALVIASDDLPRVIFCPPDAIVSGPLYGGALSLSVAAVTGFSIFFILRGAIIRHERTWDMWRAPSGKDKFSLLPFVVMVCGFAIYMYNVSAYWFATPSGLTIHSSWFAPPMSYSWADATKGRISCHIARGGGKIARFIVVLRDGSAIDLAWSNYEFAKHLAELTMLSRAIPIVDHVGDGRNCPGFILSFLAEDHH